MNFKFLLFKKEFLFGFIFCVITIVCVLGYSVWYAVGLNWPAKEAGATHVQENANNSYLETDKESVPTECNTDVSNVQDDIINTNIRSDTGPAPTKRYGSLF